MKLKESQLLIRATHLVLGRKFGGNFVPETLKKPIEDLKSYLINSKDKKFIAERDRYFKNWLVPLLIYKIKISYKSYR